jgi:VWFA-related protein
MWPTTTMGSPGQQQAPTTTPAPSGSAAPPPASQGPAAPAPATQSSGPQQPDPQASQPSPELKTQETPVPFRVRVNLVPIRVVVRDAQGRAVPNLRREDFQVTEGRTPQPISTFSVETPAKPATAPPATPTDGAPEYSGNPPANFLPPSRFVALLFDDAHIDIGDLQRVRIAAERYVDSSVQPADRVAVLTISGQTQMDFTDDREKLRETLRKLLPRPVTASDSTGKGECPSIDYYQANQIVNLNDQQAMAVAVQDAIVCQFFGDQRQLAAAQGLAQATAFRILSAGDQQTQYAMRRLEEVVRRIAALPGQRSIVLISPGFLYPRQEWELSQLIDLANRSNVVVNALDARGLYTVDPAGDIAQPPTGDPRLSGIHNSYALEGQARQTDVLVELADGTGGSAFYNNNDLDAGLRRIAAAPEVTYLLGISPTNIKYNGQFHSLKVTLVTKEKYAIQARKGYYAPKKAESEEDMAKQDIEDAVFSQEEQRTIPIDLHTQYYKIDPADAKLTILGHVDIRRMHFDKSEGRNRDNLTVVTVLFDRNGNFITGSQKVVEFRLLDATLSRLNQTGVTLKSSFDVKPGGYVVRLVVRDANGAQLSAQNGAVEIPY